MTVPYPFVASDGGRALSKRPRQKNDCTVRALAIATGTPYDVVYEKLREDGRPCGGGFNLRRWIACQCDPVIGEPEWVFGRRLVRCSFPAVKNRRRMNPQQFTQDFPKGRFLVQTAKHVAAVIDGVYLDEQPERPDRCIYGAWEVLPAPNDLDLPSSTCSEEGGERSAA